MSPATASIAAIRDGWYSESVVLPGRARERSTPRILNVLGWNAAYPQGAGVVVDPDGRYRARVDIPAPGGRLAEGRHEAASEALRRVVDEFPAVLRGRAAPEVASTRTEEEGAALLRAASETPWCPTDAEVEEITFPLETRGGAAGARAIPAGDGWELVVDVDSLERVGAVRQRAVACFLLSLTAGLRLVRAALVRGEEKSTVQFRASLPAAPDAAEVDAALGALSVAHRLGRAETRVLLASSDLARAYLTTRGWSEDPSRDNPDSHEQGEAS